MIDALRVAQPWLRFIGCVLVIAVLYWAQAVIVPVALAILLTFLLTPIVGILQRAVGRIAAVLAVVVLAFTALGFTGWAVTHELGTLVQELPTYRQTIRQKIRDVRGVGEGGSVETLQRTMEDIRTEIDEPPGTLAKPLVVRPEQVSGLWAFPGAIWSLLGPLATAGFVVVLVVFMLFEREDLRNRLIRLFGHGRLTVTTRAFDEAGQRVSRYLLVQSVVNLVFGIGVGVGLYVIGVPYPLLWAALAASFRFIPYVGPFIGAIAPILVALATLEGWTRPLVVLGLFVGLELLTNMVLETVFYAGAVGVSQVALLVAIAFWSWLWGPLGMLMATPLTVCLVVMGKYVPGLEFLTTLMSDEPVLDVDVSYYQRLLAGDQAEAAELIERHVREQDGETVYDAVMLPALTYAERDRIEERLSDEEEDAVVEATRDLLDAAIVAPAKRDGGAEEAGAMRSIPVLGVGAHGAADVLTLRMLANLLEGTRLALDVRTSTVLSSEILEAVKAGRYRIVCIADLPPSPPSKSRYLVKRLRATVPDVVIAVGRWAPPALADDTDDVLLAAGASHVGRTLLETREYLAGAVGLVSSTPADTHSAA